MNWNKKEKTIREPISTGLAAHVEYESAYKNALLECLERDAITITWHKKITPELIDLETIENGRIKEIINYIHSLNLKVYVCDISLDIKIPIYFCCIVSEKKPYFACGASANLSPIDAIESALKEAVAVYNKAIWEIVNEKVPKVNFSDIGKNLNMSDHSNYYCYNDSKEVQFLLNGRKISFDESIKQKITSFDKLLEELKNKNIEVIAKDITTKDLKNLGAFVIKVVIPKIAFLECKNPMFNTDRFDLYKKITDQVIPHPFP